MTVPHAYLFVDGSSSRHEDIGAFAAVACFGDERKVLYGIDWPTTISRCELRPIIEGLRWIKANWAQAPGFRVRVYSDSEYTVKTLCGINQRSKNMELWAAVDQAAGGIQVEYVWRERNSLPYMVFCDGLCGSLRRRMIDMMTEAAGDPRKLEPVLPKWNPKDLNNEKIETETNNGALGI